MLQRQQLQLLLYYNDTSATSTSRTTRRASPPLAALLENKPFCSHVSGWPNSSHRQENPTPGHCWQRAQCSWHQLNSLSNTLQLPATAHLLVEPGFPSSHQHTHAALLTHRTQAQTHVLILMPLYLGSDKPSKKTLFLSSKDIALIRCHAQTKAWRQPMTAQIHFLSQAHTGLAFQATLDGLLYKINL